MSGRKLPSRRKHGPPEQDALKCNPLTAVRIYSDEEGELLQAVEKYKKRAKVLFVTPCMVLAILKEMGYRREGSPGG